MKAKTIDRKFDAGEDLTKHLDPTRARRPGQKSGDVHCILSPLAQSTALLPSRPSPPPHNPIPEAS